MTDELFIQLMDQMQSTVLSSIAQVRDEIVAVRTEMTRTLADHQESISAQQERIARAEEQISQTRKDQERHLLLIKEVEMGLSAEISGASNRLSEEMKKKFEEKDAACGVKHETVDLRLKFALAAIMLSALLSLGISVSAQLISKSLLSPTPSTAINKGENHDK